MIWLTWRQFRAQAAVVFAAVAALAVILAVTGPDLAHLYDTGIATCNAHGGCTAFTNGFYNDHQAPYYGLVAVVFFTPGIVGVFWGAPLITRELEAGTHRLAWNQSVTRARWLAVKLGLIGLAAMVAAGLASLAVTWWSRPVDNAAISALTELVRLHPLLFPARGIAPIGYAAFAFALGVTVGMLIRRTVSAMAVTLAVFIAVQIAVPTWVRPHLIAPAQLTTTITAQNFRNWGSPLSNGLTVSINEPGAWITSQYTVNLAGQTVAPPPPGNCLGAPGQPTDQECFAKQFAGVRQVVSYQPASRFWAFQWYELVIFLGLAVVLGGFCAWWIRRRVS